MSYVPSKTGKIILLTIVGMLLVTPIARWIAKTSAESQNARELASNLASTGPTWLESHSRSSDFQSGSTPSRQIAPSDQIEPMSDLNQPAPVVQVMVSRQDADGLTIADLSPTFLKNMQDWTLSRVQTHAAEHGLSGGELSAESVFIESGKQKYAVTRISDGVFKPVAIIFGIKGAEAIRVTCAVREKADVEITVGPCNDKVREVFGVPLNPMSGTNG